MYVLVFTSVIDIKSYTSNVPNYDMITKKKNKKNITKLVYRDT